MEQNYFKKIWLILLSFAFSTMAVVAQNNVTGKVTDEQGQPLIGVNVTVKGTSRGTITDAEGNYVLTDISINDILSFSYIGYISQDIKATSDKIEVILKEANKLLNEIIVVGYGSTSKQKITSAVSTVDPKEMQNVPYTNMQDALQGRLSGVEINASGGGPGTIPSIDIRGGQPNLGTIGVTVTPLYVIDGIVRDQNVFTALNPEDIASISVLKDAASAAVYGSQSAGGVILITTKQGSGDNKTHVTYSDNFAISTPSYYPKLINAYQVALVTNEYQRQKGNGKYFSYTQQQLDSLQRGTPPNGMWNTNWYNEVFNQYAPQQSHNLTLQGGNDRTKYYVGLGYLDQNSIFKNSNTEDYKKVNYRSNITSSFKEIGLNVNFALSGYYTHLEWPTDDIFNWAIQQSPIAPAYNSDGTLHGIADNPIAVMNGAGYNRTNEYFGNGTLSLEWSVPWVKGLKLTALSDYSLTMTPQTIWEAWAPQYGFDGSLYVVSQPTFSQTQTNSSSWDEEFHIDYLNQFGKNSIGATFVALVRGGDQYGFNAYRANFPSDAIDQLLVGDPSTQTNNTTVANQWGQISYVGRIKYDYGARYMIEVNARYDGSDYFPPDKRYGLFPSISVGYAINNEKYFSSLKNTIDLLKIRASYGTTGLLPSTKYLYVPQFNNVNQAYVAGGTIQNGISEGALTTANQNITWYATHTTDIGLDFDVWRRLSGSIDYFYATTTNIVGNPTQSYTTPLGASLPKVLTDAAIRKEGFDFDLNWKDKVGQVEYSIGYNCTLFHTLWAKTNGDIENAIQLANPYTRIQGIEQNYNGNNIISNGVYQNYDQILNNPIPSTATLIGLGDVYYVDANGDGKIDTQDERRTGHSSMPISVIPAQPFR